MDTYSIGNFNAKIRAAILQQRQDWELPQIKNLELVIPEHYTFMADNTIFIALGIPDNYLQKTTLIRSTLPTGSYKTYLDTSPFPKSSSLQCKQINELQNELDWQHQVCWPPTHVSNYNETFSVMDLLFLELDTYRPQLDFLNTCWKQQGSCTKDILSLTNT